MRFSGTRFPAVFERGSSKQRKFSRSHGRQIDGLRYVDSTWFMQAKILLSDLKTPIRILVKLINELVILIVASSEGENMFVSVARKVE